MHKVSRYNTKGSSFSPLMSISFEQTQRYRAHNGLNNTLRLIHILDDDSLLNIFCFCRPVVWDRMASAPRILEGGEWTHQRWVVQARPCLPEVAISHTWLGILPWPFPRLCIFHPSIRHANKLISPESPPADNRSS